MLNILESEINNKPNNIIIKVFLVSITITIIGLFIIYKGYQNFKTDIIVEKEITIQIEEGKIPSDLSENFNLNKNYLKLYLKENNPNFELIAGKFKIKEKSNIEEILKQLKEPIIENEINITILEGWNIFDIDEYLSNNKLIKKLEYIKYVRDKEKINKLTEFFPFIEGIKTLEGYLYPDTYRVISNNFKINTFVIKQLENFENKITKPLSLILSPYQEKETTKNQLYKLIILASIVEKEEKNNLEKPTVAGILKKRLENGWMIGADITVCYPHELTGDQCKLVITKYISEKNEYNTRTMKGLPKTPIGNPSFETINATLNYKNTEYWFYLHDTITGKIYYADSNAKHEENKRLYLR